MGWMETSRSLDIWQAVAQGCITPSDGSGLGDENNHDKDVHVPAMAFLDAATSLATLFDLLQGMQVARSAMVGNIQRIRKHFPADSETEPPRTLQQAMVADSRPTKVVLKDQASVAHQLLWLSRVISFIELIVCAMEEDRDRTMAECVRLGYEQSLKPHHPIALQLTVSLLIKASPARDTFLQKFSDLDVDGALHAAKAMFQHIGVAHRANKAFLAANGFS